MTDASPPPRDPLGSASVANTPWGRVMAVMGLFAAAFVWLVQNFEQAKPVIEHPFMLFAWSMASCAAGGYLVHILIAQPLAARLRTTEGKVDALQAEAESETEKARGEERKLRDLVTEKSEQLASLKATVEHMQKAIDRLERHNQALEAKVSALESENRSPRRTRKPKA